MSFTPLLFSSDYLRFQLLHTKYVIILYHYIATLMLEDEGWKAYDGSSSDYHVLFSELIATLLIAYTFFSSLACKIPEF